MAQNLKRWRCLGIVKFHHSNVVKTSNEVFCNLTENGAKSERVVALLRNSENPLELCCKDSERFRLVRDDESLKTAQ